MSKAFFCNHAIILLVTMKVAIKGNCVILFKKDVALEEESAFHLLSELIAVNA